MIVTVVTNFILILAYYNQIIFHWTIGQQQKTNQKIKTSCFTNLKTEAEASQMTIDTNLE
ncbi:hypothetical protein DERF_004756 [Dermatophagoides farinae]|uniref:Uncharacterized protein n=1 Tax=Dermatophagoides farinae TaxID=6954 RepID=A0A922L6I4_DERFA|nr:hypothetical protein DERF_004756 [Dermatophagoides farinae]